MNEPAWDRDSMIWTGQNERPFYMTSRKNAKSGAVDAVYGPQAGFGGRNLAVDAFGPGASLTPAAGYDTNGLPVPRGDEQQHHFYARAIGNHVVMKKFPSPHERAQYALQRWHERNAKKEHQGDRDTGLGHDPKTGTPDEMYNRLGESPSGTRDRKKNTDVAKGGSQLQEQSEAFRHAKTPHGQGVSPPTRPYQVRGKPIKKPSDVPPQIVHGLAGGRTTGEHMAINDAELDQMLKEEGDFGIDPTRHARKHFHMAEDIRRMSDQPLTEYQDLMDHPKKPKRNARTDDPSYQRLSEDAELANPRFNTSQGGAMAANLLYGDEDTAESVRRRINAPRKAPKTQLNPNGIPRDEANSFLRAGHKKNAKVTLEDDSGDDLDLPDFQGDLYSPHLGRHVGEQGNLFGKQKPAEKPKKDLPGQGQLFEQNARQRYQMNETDTGESQPFESGEEQLARTAGPDTFEKIQQATGRATFQQSDPPKSTPASAPSTIGRSPSAGVRAGSGFGQRPMKSAADGGYTNDDYFDDSSRQPAQPYPQPKPSKPLRLAYERSRINEPYEMDPATGHFRRAKQPSAGIPAAKARQILHDGEVRGHPLTSKQRGMFGAAANK